MTFGCKISRNLIDIFDVLSNYYHTLFLFIFINSKQVFSILDSGVGHFHFGERENEVVLSKRRLFTSLTDIGIN